MYFIFNPRASINYQDYVTDVDALSDQNRRNVLRQITKLANGEGIRYESPTYGWPEDCYFLRGTVVGPTDDVLKLMELGRECEEEWGRDHGNGWLLSHPLKKLDSSSSEGGGMGGVGFRSKNLLFM